ncbi:MAG: hypothetical protein H6855_00520 [Rhodospirillales bacterium]|nr:hypothetical protein [Rhodospirillales bacterium]
MPKEDRFITFDLEEVYQALLIRCKLADLDLPKDARAIALKTIDDKKNIAVEIESADGTKKQELKFDLSFFVLALVFFCNSENIPIPKAGVKTLNVQPDSIVMRIEL